MVQNGFFFSHKIPTVQRMQEQELRRLRGLIRTWQKEAIPIARECNYIAAIDLVEQIANADLEGK